MIDSVPERVVSVVLGAVEAGGESFLYWREEYRNQDEHDDLVFYALKVSRGAINVQRAGMSQEGEWGIDFYIPDLPEGAVTIAYAQYWANALFAATTLAATLNRQDGGA